MKGDFTRWTFDPTKHYSAVLKQQGRVDIDADTNEAAEIESHLRQETLRNIVGDSGAPANNPGFRLFNRRGNLMISSGHIYVDGILCENEENISFTEQPDLPAQSLPFTEGATLRFLAYLDVWERHITAIEDPDMKEVALGETDTTTRKQTVCGVRLFLVPDDTHCLSPLPPWEQANAPGNSRLAARAQPQEDSDVPCLVPPDAGFVGLENQLYRIEIRQGGEPGEDTTFLWDCENGSVAFPIDEFLEEQPTDRIRLGSGGKFDLHSLQTGDLLELTDDIRELNGAPLSLLRRVEAIEPTTGIVTLDEPINDLSQDHHPKGRRWSCGEERPVSVRTFIPLEKGVEVRFEGEQFRQGDHWVIPARTATGDVEWPMQMQEDGRSEPIFQPPLGITHHYCRLALIDFARDDFSIVADCRNIFPPLSQNCLKIVGLETASDGQPLHHNRNIRMSNLPQGLNIEFSSPLSEDVFESLPLASQGINPAVELQVSLPEPLRQEDREFWGVEQNFGFRSVTLACNITFENDRRDRFLLRPIEPTRIWLLQLFSRLIPPGGTQPIVDRILCTLRVRGNFIWANGPGGARVYLDGETTAHPGRTRRRGLNFPSGNGQPGGDFYTWFRVVSDNVEVPLSLSVNVRLNVVSGVVSSGGAPVENATVTLTLISGPGPGAGAQQTTESDADGQYSFTALEGNYTVVAEALGTTAQQEDVEVGPVILAPGGGRTPRGPGVLRLRAISGIGDVFAGLLEANGVPSVPEFLALSANRIAEILPVSEERARRFQANARSLGTEQ